MYPKKNYNVHAIYHALCLFSYEHSTLIVKQNIQSKIGFPNLPTTIIVLFKSFSWSHDYFATFSAHEYPEGLQRNETSVFDSNTPATVQYYALYNIIIAMGEGLRTRVI